MPGGTEGRGEKRSDPSRAAEREAQARRTPNQQEQKTPRPQTKKQEKARDKSRYTKAQATSTLTKRGG